MEQKVLDSLLVARRLAQFCPTSLSIDDFKYLEQIQRESHSCVFIPPKPNVSTLNEGMSRSKSSPKIPKRFSLLFEDVKKETKPNDAGKMKYELPNLVKINPPTKANHPIVSISFLQ